MPFNSMDYIALLLVTLGCYWLCLWLPARRWIVIISSSYFNHSRITAFGIMLGRVPLFNLPAAGKIDRTHQRYWRALTDGASAYRSSGTLRSVFTLLQLKARMASLKFFQLN